MKAQKLYTAAEIAASIGIHKTSVNRVASVHGLGYFIGNQRVFCNTEAKRLRQLCHSKPGNPNFSKKL